MSDLFESVPCGLLVTTLDGRVTRVNETFLRWTGLDAAEVVGSKFRDLLDAGSQLFYETRQLPVLSLQGEVREVSLILKCSDGRTLPVLLNAVRDEAAGEIRTAIFDSTERHEYERELVAARRLAEMSEARVRALQDAATAFGSSALEDTLTEALAESARLAVSAMSSAVMVLDGDGPLALAAGSNPLMTDFPPDAPRPSTEALQTARPVLINSVEDARGRYPEVADAMLAHGVASMIVTPLLAENVAVGVVACFFGRERELDPATVDLQLALARQAAQTIVRIRLQRQLERLALLDQLTGLSNRILLHEQVSQAIAAGARDGHPVALMFLDLDGFKAVNDQLGHATGDSVLRQVAIRLRAVVRAGDAVGRYGGDEFVAICAGVDQEGAELIADRIRSAVRAPFEGVPEEYAITASVGVALCQPGAETPPTPELLLDIADSAMYRSKNGGRDRVTFELVGML